MDTGDDDSFGAAFIAHGPPHGVRTAILSNMSMSAIIGIPIHIANKTFFLDLRKSSGYAGFQGLFVLKCFIFFQILSFISLFYYSYKLYPLDKIKYLYPFIYFFSFNFSIGLGGTVTGNTTVILYGILSLGLIYLFKKRIIIARFINLVKKINSTTHYLVKFIVEPGLKSGSLTCTVKTSNVENYRKNKFLKSLI